MVQKTSYMENLVDVEHYMRKCDITLLTRLEVQHIVEYFELVAESVTGAAEAFDLNISELVEEIDSLLKEFKTLQQTI